MLPEFMLGRVARGVFLLANKGQDRVVALTNSLDSGELRAGKRYAIGRTSLCYL